MKKILIVLLMIFIAGCAKKYVAPPQEPAAQKETIKKEAVDPNDVEMLQDLITAAVNEALKKVHAELSDEMSKITGGMSIPGLF